MVSVGISLEYSTIYRRGSVTPVWYRDELLDPFVKLYAAEVSLSFILMDDYTFCKRAAVVDYFMKSDEIVRMEGPAYLPDLNSNENL